MRQAYDELATPGAERLVDWLIGSGLRVVVATSAQKGESEDLLAVCGATALLDRATTSHDAEHSKPDPDIILAALKKSRCEADRVVMVGDTPYDIEAAGVAGLEPLHFVAAAGMTLISATHSPSTTIPALCWIGSTNLRSSDQVDGGF